MPPLEPEPPRPVPSFFMRKITSPVTFFVNDREITLGGVGPPSECGKGELDAEAERFLRSLIEGEELHLERNGATTVVHWRAPAVHLDFPYGFRNGSRRRSAGSPSSQAMSKSRSESSFRSSSTSL